MGTIEYYTQALTAGLPDAVWAFDKEFKLVMGNAAFLDLRISLYGFHLKPGDSFFKGVPENVIQKWIPYYNKVFNGKRLILDDTRNVKGNFKQVRISLTPVYNQQNEVIGCMGITIDTSIEKAIESKYIQLKVGVLELTNTFKGPFRNSLEKIFALQEQLSQNFNLEQEEKAEIIRLASSELQIIQEALGKLNALEQLVK